MNKPMYSKNETHILAACRACGRVNYVEQHGTTAQCCCSVQWTEHRSIPCSYRDMSGTRYLGPACLIWYIKPFTVLTDDKIAESEARS